MDSGPVTAAGSQKKKRSKRQKCREGEDMISNLPDFIIGRILSFLPTKEAVRTSVLSKRWIYLWTFITELRFDDSRNRFHSKSSFLRFVYGVLLHLNSASIQSFSLDISRQYAPTHINEWVSAVSNRRIKKICVCWWTEGNLSSYSLFKCHSLEELELRMHRCVMTFPSFVCLSSLTVLKLSGITFAGYSSNDSKELTLNFPVIRKYETEHCTLSGVKSFTLEAPLLEVLSIVCCDYSSLSHESHTEIKFCASRLLEFSYTGHLLSETFLLVAHIASANVITLVISEDQSELEMGILLCRLFNNNAECLKLEMFPEGLVVTDFSADFPAFGMLSRLELDFVSGEILLGLLLKSPCLKTLVLKVLLDIDEEMLNSVIVPDCFLFTLEVVKFECFDGDEHELSLAKYVMENAQILERISFCHRSSLPISKLVKVQEMLCSFKRSCSSAIIEFSSD